MKNNTQINQDLTISMNSSSILSSSVSFSLNTFGEIRKKIKEIFEKEIKPLRMKLEVNKYEKNAREIRNLIIKLRKEYYLPKNETPTSNQSMTGTKAQTSNQKISNPNSSSIINQNNGNGNDNNNSRINTNTNIETNYNSQNIQKISKAKLIELDNESFMSQKGLDIQLKSPKGINIIYHIMSEIANFLMSYDDIYINYENKSAYVTVKLFLQMTTLHFIKNIDKQDFILCLMNKSCNILCKYNEIQKEDVNIRKMLALEDGELERFKKLFNYDIELIKYIQERINKEIDKIDKNLALKEQIIKEALDSNNFMNNGRRENIKIPEDEIQIKIDNIKNEIKIINDIQKSRGENYKLYLKDPIKKELEQFNLLINKISEYKSPLIRQKFIDIIIRNKEVFNYINDNILIPHIPKKDIQKLNLYPLNKRISIYSDKYIITGKTIFEVLSIPLELDYSNILENIEKYAAEFFETLKNYLKLNLILKISYLL